jgi:hypothetical protein
VEVLVELQVGKVVDLAAAVVVPTPLDFMVVLERQDKEIAAAKVLLLAAVFTAAAVAVALLLPVAMQLTFLLLFFLGTAAGATALLVQSRALASHMLAVAEPAALTMRLAVVAQVAVVTVAHTTPTPVRTTAQQIGEAAAAGTPVPIQGLEVLAS